MNKYFVGIDLGTSSAKALAFCGSKRIFLKKNYSGNKPENYLNTVVEIIDDIISETKNNIDTISFSSQTGTYVIDGKHLISWNGNEGKNELEEVLKSTTKSTFVKEIQMAHPSLVSYPLPRLLFVKKNFKTAKTVCQLKDYIVYKLTNNLISDYYTWRGLCNFNKKTYSELLLKKYDINFNLPKLVSPEKIVGEYKGIKIMVGLNDFYSGLIGMGAFKTGTCFDITGTSEHIGVISKELSNELISSPFIKNYVSYGVTQSSGPSITFTKKLFPNEDYSLNILKNNPPVFLPYLNGERAPIYDLDARGVFFGINKNTSDKELSYSVYEGIAFSLMSILENYKIKNIIVGGGAANFKILNQIKANLFNTSIEVPLEPESSAYGAYLMAKHGLNISSISSEIKYKKVTVKIEKTYQEILLKRYEIYKELYRTNKNNFKLMKEVAL